MKTFDIECGVGRASTPNSMAMNVREPGKNVNLRIDYITRSMLKDVPAPLIDLLEIAAYIYCADQRRGRGSLKLTDFGQDWRRRMNFAIPVRHPEIWQRGEILDCLEATLGFLSDDSYFFDFSKIKSSGRSYDAYFPNLLDASMEHDEVALFSGGIDSFAGAVDDLVAHRKSLTLVGHHSASKVRGVQEALIQELKQRGFARSIAYIPVWVCNEGEVAKEFTQRTRSFLFASLGFIVAHLSGKDGFTFYENGVVSINLPIAGDVVGGRATRTTHPKVLRGFETLFSLLADRQIRIRTPLQWMTKKDVVQKIGQHNMGDLLAATTSCTRPRAWTRKSHHCGSCSQCIDRRFAVLAAGMEAFEPSEGYGTDLLLGDRSMDNDLRMALSYVVSCQKMMDAPPERFLADYPEVVSALSYFPDLSPDQAGDRLYDLLQRHARAVADVITKGLTDHAQALFRQELPPGCLLSFCLSRSQVEVAPPANYDAEAKELLARLQAPILEFAFDAGNERVVFRNELILGGANFRLVKALIDDFRKAKAMDGDVPFLPAPILACRLRMTDQGMRQQVTRLRKALEPLVVSLGIQLDRDTFIENQERLGYRLHPALREVHLADIRMPDTPELTSTVVPDS